MATFNTTAWTQDQRSMSVAMAVKVLFDAAITHSGITRTLVGVTLTLTAASPSGDADAAMTEAAILTAYSDWQAESVAAAAIFAADTQAVIDAKSSVMLRGAYLPSALAMCDEIATLDDAKAYLREITVLFYDAMRNTGRLHP